MAKETPYLDVQQLTKSFGSLVLFENISFSIAEGQKVGLIAKNGTGKSTLLSVLSGKEGYDSGEIIFRRDLRVGMLEQSPVFATFRWAKLLAPPNTLSPQTRAMLTVSPHST